MKKLITLLAIIATIATFAQAPQGFNYQATVRNSAGALIVNQIVLVKFNILQNSATGTIVYSENQTANTDDLGHIALVVGQGTATTGTFSSINWGSGSYYLGIELNTGNGFVDMGTTQLLSVPYALYSSNSTPGPQGPAGPAGPQGLPGVNGTNGSSGVASFYLITINMFGGIIDFGGTPIASVLGPNGENKAALEAAGWSFSTPTSTRLTIGRPSGFQVQPIVNIMTHGNNSGNVYSKAPSNQSTAGYTAVQTLASSAWTTLDIYSINNTNTGCASSGTTTVTVTFGLIR